MITSLQNPQILRLKKLHKRQERKEEGRLLVEGNREISHVPRHLIEKIFTDSPQDFSGYDCEVIEVSKQIIEKVTYRGSEGIAVVKAENRLPHADAKLLLCTDHIEKPGNLGAMLRTLDAAGFDGLIAVGGVDTTSPNVIRASLGAYFTKTVCEMTQEEMITYCQEKGFTIIAASPEAPSSLYETNLPEKVCVVIGSEAFGVSQPIKDAAKLISLPMKGEIDSLNAATTFGIIAYEILRQRHFIRR